MVERGEVPKIGINPLCAFGLKVGHSGVNRQRSGASSLTPISNWLSRNHICWGL
jgi:hypothetical protein